MCSAKELDIGTDADGLMILSGNPEPGMPVDRLFSHDKTLELEITANRGDCLSYLGVAREIGAYYQKQIRIPKPPPSAPPPPKFPKTFHSVK